MIGKIFIKYIWSFDTIFSLITSMMCIYFLPNFINGDLAKDLLSMGIGVLSIIFSIFFAAIAFIISASDDKFVSFLEEEGLFTDLINSFKWTVGSLFIALFFSIIIYSITSFNITYNEDFKVNEYILCVFCFLFFYSLIATILSTNDAIKYSKSRIKYINKKMTKKKRKRTRENPLKIN
jgi:hypothetical protein